MSMLGMVKSLTIKAGVYRPARWVARRLRPSLRQALLADIGFYAALVAPGSLCFDVGANVGEKSEALLRSGMHVVAFEPNPMVVPELRARCRHWRHWTLVEAAAGSAIGKGTFYARQSHVNSGLLAGGGSRVLATYNVSITTLDAAIERFGRPQFCKIDVEGWELEVLRGLSQPIPLICFEFQLNERSIQSTLACMDRLVEFGPSEVRITPAETPSFHFDNWVPLEKFRAWFPGDLKDTLPGEHYGDIFVRSVPPPTASAEG